MWHFWSHFFQPLWANFLSGLGTSASLFTASLWLIFREISRFFRREYFIRSWFFKPHWATRSFGVVFNKSWLIGPPETTLVGVVKLKLPSGRCAQSLFVTFFVIFLAPWPQIERLLAFFREIGLSSLKFRTLAQRLNVFDVTFRKF